MRRWLVFTVVGLAGFGLQLAVLAALVHGGAAYLVATAVAVEAAILHNFVWHERWTWSDRPATASGRLLRLSRFHLLNGSVSLAGNLGIMWLLVGGVGIAPLPANLIAVLACSVVNFVAGDALVWKALSSSGGLRPAGPAETLARGGP